MPLNAIFQRIFRRKTALPPTKGPAKLPLAGDQEPWSAPGLGPDGRPPRIELNVVFLIKSLAVLLVLAAMLLGWHQWQIYRQADVLLDRVASLEETERWREAAELCFRYRQLRQDDQAIAVRLAQDFDRSAQAAPEKRRARELWADVLLANSAETIAHQRLAELELEMGTNGLAYELAQQTLQKAPTDPRSLRVMALAAYRLRHSGRQPIEQVANQLSMALDAHPQDYELAHMLAELYRHDAMFLSATERAQRADAVFARVVSLSKLDAKAWLARAQYRMRYNLEGSERDLAQAQRLKPDDFDVLLTVAEARFRHRDLEEARRYYQRLTELKPTDARGFFGWGATYSLAGDKDQAIRIWTKGRQQTKNSAGEAVLLLSTVHALIDTGEAGSIDSLIARLQEMAKSWQAQGVAIADIAPLQAEITFAQASSLMAAHHWTEAEDVLQQARATASQARDQDAAVELQIRLLRASAYCSQQLGAWDRAARAYEKAADLDLSEVIDRIAAGEAWWKCGNRNAAREQFLAATETQPRSAAAGLGLARVELFEEAPKPTGQRIWRRFDAAIAKARSAPELADDVTVLEANAVALRKGAEAAVKLLRGTLIERPHSSTVAEALGMFLLHAGRLDEVQTLVTQWDRCDDSAELAHALQRLVWIEQGRWQAAIADLHQSGLHAPPGRQRPLNEELAQLLLRHSQPEHAEAELRTLLSGGEPNATLLALGSEAALATGDAERLTLWLNGWKSLAGNNSATWRYYRGRQILLTTASALPVAAQQELKQLIGTLRTERPDWAAVWALDGAWLERNQRWTEAIEAYKHSLHLGERSRETWQHLVTLLCRQYRVSEAANYVGLATAMDSDPRATEVSLRVRFGQTAEAVELARHRQADAPQDAERWLLLGQALLADHQSSEAGKALQQAVRLRPELPAAWLFMFEAELSNPDRIAARKILAELETNTKLEAVSRDVLAARAWARLEETGQADRRYRKLLAEATDVNVMFDVALFFERYDPPTAEQALRRAHALAPQAADVSRRLARLWARYSVSAPSPRALELLKSLVADLSTAEPSDVQLQVELLARDPRPESLAAASKLLESWLAKAPIQPAWARLMLAGLYDRQQQTAKADGLFRQAIAGPEQQLQCRLAYADFLLRHQRLPDVAQQLMQLEKIAPDNLGTIALRVRYSAQTKRTSEIEPVLQAYVDNQFASHEEPAQHVAALEAVAALATTYHQREAAGRWYRQAWEIEPMQPAALIRFLAGQKRYLEAVDVAREAWHRDIRPAQLLVLLNALLEAGPQPKLLDHVEPLVQDVAKRYPAEFAWQTSWALVQFYQGNTAAAVEDQRQLVAAAPQHVMLRNNLALMLASQPKAADEAVSLAETLIRELPDELRFHDTLALVWLLRGEPRRAKTTLQPWVDQSKTTPQLWLHYALACRDSGDEKPARRAFDQVRPLPASQASWLPSERQWFAELSRWRELK